VNWSRFFVFADSNIAKTGVSPMIDELLLFRGNLMTADNINIVRWDILLTAYHSCRRVEVARYQQVLEASLRDWKEVEGLIPLACNLSTEHFSSGQHSAVNRIIVRKVPYFHG